MSKSILKGDLSQHLPLPSTAFEEKIQKENKDTKVEAKKVESQQTEALTVTKQDSKKFIQQASSGQTPSYSRPTKNSATNVLTANQTK